MKDIDKRRQRKMDKASEEKKLLRLWRRQQKLWEGSRSCNIVELDKPIRSGYVRSFILRPDIAKGKEAGIYKPLLPWMNSRTYCHDKSFMRKPWNGKAKKPIDQTLSSIRHKEWIQLEPTLTAKQKSMFDKVWHQAYNKGRMVGGWWEWHFTKPWMFILNIQPYYITHKVLINPQLESETKELWNRIYASGRINKIGKMLGWRQNNTDTWESTKARLIRKALKNDDKLAMIDHIERYEDIYEGEY